MTIVRLGIFVDYISQDDYWQHLARSALPPKDVTEALDESRNTVSFRIDEFAVLGDGREISLRADRGFTLSVSGPSGRVDPWRFLSLEDVEHDARCAVMPDDDPPDDVHHWAWLAERLRANGCEATPERLKSLPYEIRFSDRLRVRLPAARGHAGD